MNSGAPQSASDNMAGELASVRQDARDCRRCPLWEIGTQTVFGEGPADARLIFLGEAPGYTEDQSGRPFVGASGRLFDEALAAAELDRGQVYVTNTVKHRPYVPGGQHGRNRPPKQSEINACAVWLESELRLLRPLLVCCLGAVAAKAILGRQFRLTAERGKWHQHPDGFEVLATLHPSFVLIQRQPNREDVRTSFFDDIAAVARRYRATAA